MDVTILPSIFSQFKLSAVNKLYMEIIVALEITIYSHIGDLSSRTHFAIYKFCGLQKKNIADVLAD